MLSVSPFAMSIEQVVLPTFLATVEERASLEACDPSKGRTVVSGSASFSSSSSLGISPGVHEARYCSAQEYFAMSQRTVAHAIPVLRVQVAELHRLVQCWKAWVKAVEPFFFSASDGTSEPSWDKGTSSTAGNPLSEALPRPPSLFSPSTPSFSSFFTASDGDDLSLSDHSTLSEADATLLSWTSSSSSYYFFFLSRLLTTFVLCRHIRSALSAALTSPTHPTPEHDEYPPEEAEMQRVFHWLQHDWSVVLLFLCRICLTDGKGGKGWRKGLLSGAWTPSSQEGAPPLLETRGKEDERIRDGDLPPAFPLSPHPKRAKDGVMEEADANDVKNVERRQASRWRSYLADLFPSVMDTPATKAEDPPHTDPNPDGVSSPATLHATLSPPHSPHSHGRSGGGPWGASAAPLGVIGQCVLYGIVRSVLEEAHRNEISPDPHLIPTTPMAATAVPSSYPIGSHVPGVDVWAMEGRKSAAASLVDVDWVDIALQSLFGGRRPHPAPPSMVGVGEERNTSSSVLERAKSGPQRVWREDAPPSPSSHPPPHHHFPPCGVYDPEEARTIGRWVLEALTTQLTREVPPSTEMFRHLLPSSSSTVTPQTAGRAACKKTTQGKSPVAAMARPERKEEAKEEGEGGAHAPHSPKKHPQKAKTKKMDTKDTEDVAAATPSSVTPPAYRRIAQRILHGVLSSTELSFSPASLNASSSPSTASFLVCRDRWWFEWVWGQVVVPLLLSFGGDPSFLPSPALPLGAESHPIAGPQEADAHDILSHRENARHTPVKAVPWASNDVRAWIVCVLRSRLHPTKAAPQEQDGSLAATIPPSMPAPPPSPDGTWETPERSGPLWEEREAVVMWVATLFDFLFPSPHSESFRQMLVDRPAWASAVGMREVLWEVLYDTLLDTVREGHPGLEGASSCTEKDGNSSNPPPLSSSTSSPPPGMVPLSVSSPHSAPLSCVDASRKMTMQLRVCYVLKRLIYWQTMAEEMATTLSSLSSASSPSSSAFVEPFLFHPVLFPSWDAARSPIAWENFFILLEAANEYNLHLLLPAMKRLDTLVLQSSSGAAPLLSSRWVEVAIVKLLSHPNTAVRKVILRRLWHEWPSSSSSSSLSASTSSSSSSYVAFRKSERMIPLPTTTATHTDAPSFSSHSSPRVPHSSPPNQPLVPHTALHHGSTATHSSGGPRVMAGMRHRRLLAGHYPSPLFSFLPSTHGKDDTPKGVFPKNESPPPAHEAGVWDRGKGVHPERLGTALSVGKKVSQMEAVHPLPLEKFPLPPPSDSSTTRRSPSGTNSSSLGESTETKGLTGSIRSESRTHTSTRESRSEEVVHPTLSPSWPTCHGGMAPSPSSLHLLKVVVQPIHTMTHEDEEAETPSSTDRSGRLVRAIAPVGFAAAPSSSSSRSFREEERGASTQRSPASVPLPTPSRGERKKRLLFYASTAITPPSSSFLSPSPSPTRPLSPFGLIPKTDEARASPRYSRGRGPPSPFTPAGEKTTTQADGKWKQNEDRTEDVCEALGETRLADSMYLVSPSSSSSSSVATCLLSSYSGAAITPATATSSWVSVSSASTPSPLFSPPPSGGGGGAPCPHASCPTSMVFPENSHLLSVLNISPRRSPAWCSRHSHDARKDIPHPISLASPPPFKGLPHGKEGTPVSPTHRGEEAKKTAPHARPRASPTATASDAEEALLSWVSSRRASPSTSPSTEGAAPSFQKGPHASFSFSSSSCSLTPTFSSPYRCDPSLSFSPSPVAPPSVIEALPSPSSASSSSSCFSSSHSIPSPSICRPLEFGSDSDSEEAHR